MNRWTYSGSMVLGLVSTALGVGLQFGAGWGLASFGLLLIGLTGFGAFIATRGERG